MLLEVEEANNDVMGCVEEKVEEGSTGNEGNDEEDDKESDEESEIDVVFD